MTPEEQKAFDEVQAEKKEIGIVDELEEEDNTEKSEESEESTQDEDKSEDKDSEESDEDDEEDSEEDEEEESKDDKSKDDTEDSDEDDSEDDEESDDDDDDAHRPGRVSIKEHKQMKKALREEITTLKEELAKKNPSEKKVTGLEERAKKLAETLGFDVEKTKILLSEARDAALDELQSKNNLSEEDRKVFDEMKRTTFMKEQETIFNDQWGKVVPEIKKIYPNATDKQLQDAKAEMDKLAHSKNHHTHDMDYILFKQKANFDKILHTPKQKTFENGRPSIDTEDSNDDEFPTFDPSMSPAQFERFEKRRQAILDRNPNREKTKIRGMNQRSGKIEEREE